VETHDTEDVEIGDGKSAESANNVRHLGAFQAKLRNTLPPSVYFTQKSINTIAGVANDRYRVRGLDKFTFALHRIRRDRGKWLIVYYARENNGIGEAVAELRISVGKIERGQLALGAVAELTSFMPARTEPFQFGKLSPCCRIVIPLGGSGGPLQWYVKEPEGKTFIQLSGQGSTPSFRVDLGLTDDAPEALKAHTSRKAIKKAFEAAEERGEQRRWLYASNWKEWPASIKIRCFDAGPMDTRVLGTYKRAKCRQTTNQSGLWIQSCESGATDAGSIPLYLLIKPSVNRNGPDSAILSTSMDHNDVSSILAELDPTWQPCDALLPDYQRQSVTCYQWKPDDSISCIVPASTIMVNSVEEHGDSLVVVNGLKETEIAMMTRGARDGQGSAAIKLNVFSGQEAQQVIRVINSTVVAPILKFASMEGLKHDLSTQALWKPLNPPAETPFGSCKKVIPTRPTERWVFDDDRGAWERSSEPGASRKYYLEVCCSLCCF
jgi:hypothetical protein